MSLQLNRMPGESVIIKASDTDTRLTVSGWRKTPHGLKAILSFEGDATVVREEIAEVFDVCNTARQDAIQRLYDILALRDDLSEHDHRELEYVRERFIDGY